jgi:hypothetical protein
MSSSSLMSCAMAEVSMSNESGTTGWLPFSNEVTLPTVSTDGKPYVLDTKIKLHIDGTNPVMKLDETGFYYAEHTMKINENEAVGTYFNEIGLFFEVTQGATKFYVPYSKFVFAGLPNLGGKNSYTILYGTYL